MITRRGPPLVRAGLVALVVVACSEPSSDATGVAPNLDRSHHRDDQPTVVVDPSGRHGRPTTITAGIALAPAGGRVLVLPGTYPEALVINKGLTLEGVGSEDDDDDRGRGERESVIIAPTGTPLATIEVATPNPVTIRHVTVWKPGSNGILGSGVVDVTLERLAMLAVGTGPGTNRLVRMSNNASQTGGRARLIVRESFLDGDGLQTNAISLQADIDAVIEGNRIRRTGGICMFFISFSPVGINADIVDNDLDECEGRTAIDVGPTPTQTTNFSTIGVVNIVGNRILNSSASCLPTTAIHYQLYTGRIERNSIINFLQPCAAPITDALPAAIWVGSLRGFTPASPMVRFNDVAGNALAGLRIGPNQPTSLDARCNYWGSASGPSGAGLSGTGDAVVVETGGARPVLAPFATTSVADRRRHHGDHDDDDDDRHGRGSCQLEFSLWSAPVNLGTTINTLASEQNPNISPDGLSLYLVSDRAGGTGLDIWVSQRASVNAAWGSPVNLGSVINSPGAESAPSLSGDGRLLFFFSDFSGRPGAQGGQDLYVSRRADPQDDFAWGAPVNLGPYVNTAADEAGSSYVPGKHGMASLYFNRRPITVPAAPYDIYSVPLTRDGLPREPATPIAELNSPAGDFGPEVSSDGREVIFGSGRPGTFGGNDLWVSIRRRVDDPWSTPENLGTPINTALNDRHPSLSADGRTLFFASTRSGTLGSDDLWISTRTRIGHRDR